MGSSDQEPKDVVPMDSVQPGENKEKPRKNKIA